MPALGAGVRQVAARATRASAAATGADASSDHSPRDVHDTFCFKVFTISCLHTYVTLAVHHRAKIILPRVRLNMSNNVFCCSSEVQMTRPSALVTLLVNNWSWGLMSAAQIQKITKAAMDDGLHHPHVERIARLGTGGLYERNINTEFINCFAKPALYDAVGTVAIPFKRHIKGTQLA